MIAYLYFKVKKILKIVKKLTFFLKKDVKCKMFLKKRMRVPLLKAPYCFSIENMPRFLTFRVITCI